MPTKKVNKKIQKWQGESEPARLKRALILTLVIGLGMFLLWAFLLLPLQLRLAPGSQSDDSTEKLNPGRVIQLVKNIGGTVGQFIAAFQKGILRTNSELETLPAISPTPTPTSQSDSPFIINPPSASPTPTPTGIDENLTPSHSNTPEISPSPS